jgi:hypothetical protein
VADFRRACLPAAGGDAPPLAGAPRGPAATQPPAGISLAEGCSFIGAVLFADVAVAEDP